MVLVKDKNGKKLTPDQVQVKVANRIYNVWLDFELMVLRWVGHIPFHSIRKVIYQIAGIRLGRGSTLHMWGNFYDPKKISIGEDTIIGDHVFLDGRDYLTIGNHVAIASHVSIYNSQHNIHSEDFEAEYGDVKVGDYVFIGPHAIILPGIHIGTGAVISAGAVVTKNVPDFTVIAGVPAGFVGERKCKSLHYRLGRARLFQ